MAPKDKNDGPKTKRVLTPEQLEKLAQARAKANEVRQAMKEDREEAQMNSLQAKMDKIKAKKTPKEVIPEEPTPEPTSVPIPDEESVPDKEEKTAKKVEPVIDPGSRLACEPTNTK